MQKITSVTELKDAILLLEKQKADQSLLLKQELSIAFESLKPVNLIKNTFNELMASPDLRGNIIDTGLGMAAGYISKKVIIGNSNTLLRKIGGSILQMVVSKLVSKNSENIKSTGMNLFKKIFAKKNNEQEHVHSI
ncbi:MAG: hypothetical protein ACT4ON_00140 [Bacteroidota bacterium]